MKRLFSGSANVLPIDSLTSSLKSSREELDAELIIRKLLSLRRHDFTRSGNIKEKEIVSLCTKVSDILLEQPTLLELLAPINVVGDIHGQFKDLIRWFDKKGFPPKHNYLFLGDYVDRGTHSIETICLLMAFKIKYPVNFFLLRGNHETKHVNLAYGFYNDCLSRYSRNVFKQISAVFNSLPLAAVIESKIFCCHGGIGPKLKYVSQINNIKRPFEVPIEGIACDLVWADPSTKIAQFEKSQRGVSFYFGNKALSTFLFNNNLDLICRAHQVVMDGYEMFFNETLVTIFSAPNYCNSYDNVGAMMCVKEDLTCLFDILLPILPEEQ